MERKSQVAPILHQCRKYAVLFTYFVCFCSLALFTALKLGALSGEDALSIVFPLSGIVSGANFYNSQFYCERHHIHGTLFNVLTKLNVFYTSDQWFHMAENCLVQLHLLQTSNRLSNSSVVLYNFDTGET